MPRSTPIADMTSPERTLMAVFDDDRGDLSTELVVHGDAYTCHGTAVVGIAVTVARVFAEDDADVLVCDALVEGGGLRD